jgi:hypothetical protein
MDFELSEEHLAFQDMVHKWVDKETPKSWARELEKDEHNYPFALWEKFTEAGFHGVGIAEEFGGQGGDVIMQMILGRELARSLGGLSWIWGITSFAGSKSIDIYGSDSQKKRFLPQIAAGKLRAAIAFTRTRRRHGRPGCAAYRSGARRRRLGIERGKDLEFLGARCRLSFGARAYRQERGQAPSGRESLLGSGEVARGQDHAAAETGNALHGLVLGSFRQCVRAG